MKMGKIGANLYVNFSFAVVFTLCFLTCVVSVFVFGSSDFDQSQNQNPKANPNLGSECSSACEKLEGHENRIKELEKQSSSPCNQMNHLETCPEENIWLSDIQKMLKKRGRKITKGSNDNQKTTENPHVNGNEKCQEMVCDFENDGGGWTIIQKRSGPKEDFNRTWTEYEKGFESLNENFWLGLENIHTLTRNGDQELRIELEDFQGEKRCVKYSSFWVSDASDFYRLFIGGYSGDAGDSMIYSGDFRGVHNGMQFSTPDKDNDKHPENCAAIFESGWWFNQCHAVNLNGLYREEGENVPRGGGIIWHSWKGLYSSLAKTEMKIRGRN